MNKVLRATYKIIHWAKSFCLRTVYEVVVDSTSCGIIHITESGITNIGINSAPHVPVHWWTSLPAVYADTVPVTNTNTHKLLWSTHNGSCGGSICASVSVKSVFHVLCYVFCSFLVTQFLGLPYS